MISMITTWNTLQKNNDLEFIYIQTSGKALQNKCFGLVSNETWETLQKHCFGCDFHEKTRTSNQKQWLGLIHLDNI